MPKYPSSALGDNKDFHCIFVLAELQVSEKNHLRQSPGHRGYEHRCCDLDGWKGAPLVCTMAASSGESQLQRIVRDLQGTVLCCQLCSVLDPVPQGSGGGQEELCFQLCDAALQQLQQHSSRCD